jgi:hypothetical protein
MERTLRRLKVALLLSLVGISIAATLSGCIIEENGGGHGWHHEGDWR